MKTLALISVIMITICELVLILSENKTVTKEQ
jgi:hypothetical protein